MGTVSDWHKKQRKKELKKNKEARLAARNERVVTEKSIPGIEKEIAALEASAHSAQHSTQMKLDRLRKELKLLQKHQESSPPKKKRPAAPRTPLHEPLADPRVSIYYDATMNPFGEPPPGRPRLFHRRGGGTTLTLREACVPGEEDSVVQQGSATNGGERTQPTIASTSPDQKPLEKTSTPNEAKDDKDSHKRKRTAVPKPSASKASTAVTTTTTLSSEPKKVPELPQASAAVKRSKKLAVDIWASSSELEYDESWEYRDMVANQIQGPFGTEQMLTWIRAGHFPGHTFVRRVTTEDWKPLSEVKDLWGSNKKRKADAEPTDVQKRIAALRGTSEGIIPDSVHGRIAALRGDAPPRDDVQSRIAALRGDQQADINARVAQIRNDEGNHSKMMDVHSEPHEVGHDEAIGETVPVQETTIGANHPLPASSSGSSIHDATEDNGVVAQSKAPSSVQLPPPPPPPPPPLPQIPDENKDVIPAYPLHGTTQMPMPLPPPPPAPILEEDIPPYPIAPTSEVDIQTYPLPVADEGTDVITPYPMPSLPQDNELISPYPTITHKSEDEASSSETPTGMVKEKSARQNLKTITIDKSLAAFLPTALQRKRPPKSD